MPRSSAYIPSINLPQAAVLGMHTIKEKPVVVDGQIVIRPIMVVALTYDHRLLDGREAVTFLGEWGAKHEFDFTCRRSSFDHERC
jgi:pyruvate/2-oxoglutarate dehydrogenase complex dihydrolipoamide acyltransferase (E2) component